MVSSAAMCPLAGMILALLWPAGAPQAQPASPDAVGKSIFERACARCHGADGHGGEMGPGITARLALRSDAELATLIESGLPARGMPPTPLGADELHVLLPYLRTLTPSRDLPPRVDLPLDDGTRVRGVALSRGAHDVQVLDDDGRLRLLRATASGHRTVTSDVEWPTYHGQPGGNRYSPLDEIAAGTVSRLAPRWVFPVPGAVRLQVTPLVVDGVMYVTNANECFALDAGSGRRIWHYQRPRTRGLAGDAASGINRGVAVAGDRVFMVTDHAHLIALNRFTGDLVWETTMADWRQNYGATSAPLVVGDLVVSGISGGDEGVRGFLAAFDRASGKEVWRFWTVPKPGEPHADTWRGRDIEHGCASTWLTGTYDAALDTLYWPTGNPCPDYDGRERVGDNLYSDSVLALDPSTGRLKWHFQYTPHDVWDWDAQQPVVLVDADWRGARRRLLLHANRNGFFYILDRTNGAMLAATPFVTNLTWARGIGVDGRPVLVPGQAPTPEGVKVCPSVEGATNWFSSAFSPATGLYYVQALEKCTIYSVSPETWRAGHWYYAGATRQVPGEPGQKVLRALDIRTGKTAWEVPQTGPANSWGGALATAGGLVFFGDDSGVLKAVDASTGAPLWQFPANTIWKASPMTYRFDGRQHIAVAAGPNILAFALVD